VVTGFDFAVAEEVKAGGGVHKRILTQRAQRTQGAQRERPYRAGLF
jgi:hypothetical protein